MNLRQLWTFSSKIHTEIYLGSRIQSAGNKKEAILDRYKDNLSDIKSNSRLSSLIVASILIVPSFIAVSTVEQSISRLGAGNINKVFFTNSIAIATYYVFNMVFMLLFGLMTIASLLRGRVFKFLHTLPLSKAEIQVLGLMTLVRLLLFQLVIILLVFPIGLLWVTQSPVIFFVSFMINSLNLLLMCYGLIIVIEKMSNFLFNKDNRFGWKSIARYLFLVTYIVIGFSVYYFIGTIGTLLNDLYQKNFLPEATLQLINQLLAIVPFPFSTGYLLSIVVLGVVPDLTTLIATALGLGLLLTVTYLTVRKGNAILLNIAFKEPPETEKPSEAQTEVVLRTRTPFMAYLRMNLLIVSRDLSSLISLTMALLFPILPLIQGRGQNVFISFLFYSGFIIFFASNALSASEGSVGGLTSSLPFSNREMLRVKQILLALTYLMAYGLVTLVSGFSKFNAEDPLLVLFLSMILPGVFLIFKSYFFGRINNEYTLYDVEDTSNFMRNFGLIIPVMLIVGLEYLLFFVAPVPETFRLIIILGVNLTLFLILEIVSRAMFN